MFKAKIIYIDNNEIKIFIGNTKEELINNICKYTGADNGLRQGDRRIKFRQYKVEPFYK